MKGPLAGLKILEFAGIGAGPHCAMMLADMGADVIRIDRPMAAGLGVEVAPRFDILMRGRRSIAIDLKTERGREIVLRMISKADALVESFRPGVMERNGLGPEICLAANRKLVYARLTGWGQYGPYASMAGHDINYIALTGALHAFGAPGQPPQPPLNLLGDFGGGALHCAVGILGALFHAQRTGEGQVVDAAMVDGVTAMMSLVISWRHAGQWSEARHDNFVDGGAPYYSTYATADDHYIAIGAMEDKFYDLLLEKLNLLTVAHMRPHTDRTLWPRQRGTFESVFASRTRQEWCDLLDGTDTCFSPVLTMDEAARHPHMRAREVYMQIEDVLQPAPAPRLSGTPARVRGGAPNIGQQTSQILREFGWDAATIQAFVDDRTVVQGANSPSS